MLDNEEDMMDSELLIKNSAEKLAYMSPVTEVIRYSEEDIILCSCCSHGNFSGGGVGGGSECNCGCGGDCEGNCSCGT